MNDKFQLWSPPKLDLSLDSFSDDLIQQFDNKRHQNVTTVTPPEHNPEREILETMIASPKQQDYLPHSPVSSSLPSEHDTGKDEDEKDEDEKDEDEENEGEDDDAEVEQEEQEEKKEEETQLDEESTEQRVSNEVAVEQEHEENASLRKSSSLSQRKVSEEEVEKKTSDEVIAAVSSKVAPPDIKAASVPEQPPVTPKRRSFFSFRFC